MQEPPLHAKCRIALGVCMQAITPPSALPKPKVVEMIVPKSKEQKELEENCRKDSVSLIERLPNPRRRGRRLEVYEKNGGDDGTRTRGLCRDRAAF